MLDADTQSPMTAVEREAMPRPVDTSQITFRAPTPWLAGLDALAAKLSRPGIELTRTDAVRAACARGLQVMLAEEGLAPLEPSAPPMPAPLSRSKRAKPTKR